MSVCMYICLSVCIYLCLFVTNVTSIISLSQSQAAALVIISCCCNLLLPSAAGKHHCCHHCYAGAKETLIIHAKMSLSLFTNVTREVSGHIFLVLYYLQGIFTLSQSLKASWWYLFPIYYNRVNYLSIKRQNNVFKITKYHLHGCQAAMDK